MTINLLALAKGDERYLFTYDDDEASRQELHRLFGRFAANPDLSFSWYDCAVLGARLRQVKQKGRWCDSANPGLRWTEWDPGGEREPPEE
jgi:hypothetical protein